MDSVRRATKSVLLVLLAGVFPGLMAVKSPGADWPMARADAARSAYTAESLPARLSLRWTVREQHAPQPAWPYSERMTYDRAYQVVVAGTTFYYGTSSDGRIVARDAKTGGVRWTFFTDAPVRFAPVVWQDRLFAASDDGLLYCLDATDGRVLWKFRGGPKPDMLLGNDHMISRWPARGGPVVVEGTLYFAAGIWPSEGIFLYALDAATGKKLWCNDSSGAMEMDQPHGGARAKSGASAQGDLAVAGDALIVPTGRAVPAVFDRADGDFRYLYLQPNRALGGSDVAAFDGYFVNSGTLFATETGAAAQPLIKAPKKPAEKKPAKVVYEKADLAGQHSGSGVRVAIHPQWIIVSAKDQLFALDRKRLLVDKQVLDRKGRQVKMKALRDPLWTVKIPANSINSLIVAGDSVIAGGKGQVTRFAAASGEKQWSAAVEGAVFGLAVAGGRLYASTDRGTIYCFDESREAATRVARSPQSAAKVASPRPRTNRRLVAGEGQGVRATETVLRVPTPLTPNPSPAGAGEGSCVAHSRPNKPGSDSPYATAAREILDRTGITQGYCLDLACGEGFLAEELARRTKLRIYAVEAEPASVQAARRRLAAAGLYGVRVTVHQADPATVPYPDYFADLVVSGRSAVEGEAVVAQKAMARLQRPAGGIARIGRPGAMQQSVRGPLEGSRDWSHQYADSANTLCSGDARLRAPLKMLWFRDTDLLMPSRHGRGPAPLVSGARMFVEGMDTLRAVNVYNGATLWEVRLPKGLKSYHQDHLTGVAATGSNICLGDGRLFVHTGDKCLCLDVETGRQAAAWDAPRHADGTPGVWGYIAYRDGILFGSLVNERHLVKESWRSYLGRLDMTQLYSESSLLFAMDPNTGRIKWTYVPEHSVRHNAVAVGAGRMFLIDRPLAFVDTPQSKANSAKVELPPGRLVCLDSRTGQQIWQTGDDAFGTLLALSEKHDVLLMSYQATRFRLDSELGGRMAAYRSSDGAKLWDIKAKYESRPVLNDRTIYAEPGKWDLLTGERLPFQFSRSYGCGILAGSARLLVFRSATLGYRDLQGTSGTENYGGIRPGCWINAIPAGGLVLMADAASWCTCSYLNQATIALQPAK